MVTIKGGTSARPVKPRLRPGDFVEIEVPWTVDLPSPHRSGVLSEHFTIEQCTILCETIEEARQANHRRHCRLVDLFGKTWLAEVNPGRDDENGHVRWLYPGKHNKEAK